MGRYRYGRTSAYKQLSVADRQTWTVIDTYIHLRTRDCIWERSRFKSCDKCNTHCHMSDSDGVSNLPGGRKKPGFDVDITVTW